MFELEFNETYVKEIDSEKKEIERCKEILFELPDDSDMIDYYNSIIERCKQRIDEYTEKGIRIICKREA